MRHSLFWYCLSSFASPPLSALEQVRGSPFKSLVAIVSLAVWLDKYATALDGLDRVERLEDRGHISGEDGGITVARALRRLQRRGAGGGLLRTRDGEEGEEAAGAGGSVLGMLGGDTWDLALASSLEVCVHMYYFARMHIGRQTFGMAVYVCRGMSMGSVGDP